MPKQSFALEKGGEKRVEISWKGMWKDINVSMDGETVGIIPDHKSLQAGQEFSLKDGSTLKVQLVQKFTAVELQVLRNGEPLPGTASDPKTRLKLAAAMVYLVAGFSILGGLVSLLFNVEILQQLGIGAVSILFGLVFLVLGFFVQRRSMVALILAIIIFAIDGLAGFFIAALQGYSAGGGVVARIILLIPMFQGVGAINALKGKE